MRMERAGKNKTENNIQPSWPDKSGQWRNYWAEKAGNVSEHDSGRVLARIAKYRVGIGSFCPLAELAI